MNDLKLLTKSLTLVTKLITKTPELFVFLNFISLVSYFVVFFTQPHLFDKENSLFVFAAFFIILLLFHYVCLTSMTQKIMHRFE